MDYQHSDNAMCYRNYQNIKLTIVFFLSEEKRNDFLKAGVHT